MIVEFTIHGQPVGKQRPRVVRGHAYTPEKTRNYEHLVQYEYIRQGGKYLDGAIKADIVAYFPVSKSAQKKGAKQGDKCCKKPDCDNIAKIILDALNGIAYKDDSQVAVQSAQKLYNLEPRVDVRLEEIK